MCFVIFKKQLDLRRDKMKESDVRAVNAIRILSADMVQKANSGHPGTPLGAAPMAFELWARHMNHNPQDAGWLNRDRFVLSGGHASVMLYSLLHLFGYGLTTEDLANFRQFGSLTPGHPEHGLTTGVDASTGPLGAGMAMAVGMAMAEAHLAAVFNKAGFPVFDHYTFALGGDGCMMEGISSEAFSLAGTLGLSKLIILYDSNRISIEGSTDLAFTEDVGARMKAFGFQVIDVPDGNDLSAIGAAIEEAKADTARPSFIVVHTQIGYGCPAKQGTAAAHGEPLGEENVAALRATLGWEESEPFLVPEDIYTYIKGFARRGAAAQNLWEEMLEKYFDTYPQMKELWDRYFVEDYAQTLIDDASYWSVNEKEQATRASGSIYLNKLKDKVPSLMGGSADLGPSNKSVMTDAGEFSAEDYSGRNIHFGVRELAMGGIANGLCLHGGIKPYVSTFFVFSDYLKPMLRLAALMHLPITYILTHDSIGVGEDGPTHQPIEQLPALRAVPGISIYRPADTAEAAAAWYAAAASKDKPTLLVLSRQNLPTVCRNAKDALKGAYIVRDSIKETPDAIIIASGSEVGLAVEARRLLKIEEIDVRVVSMPSMDVFEQQDEAYKESVLPRSITARVAVEAASGFGWERYVGDRGGIIAMNSFGESAPAGLLFKKFGFTPENVAAKVKEVL